MSKSGFVLGTMTGAVQLFTEAVFEGCHVLLSIFVNARVVEESLR